MQPTTLLLLALIAIPSTISAPAPPLSHHYYPTNTTTTTTTRLLETRAAGKWASKFTGGDPKIGSFTDSSCTLKSLIPPPPSINKLSGGYKCIKFTPGTDNVGINWGAVRAEAITFYQDEKCTVYATKKMYSPAYGMDNGKGKADKCVSYRATGGGWHSVGFQYPTGNMLGGWND